MEKGMLYIKQEFSIEIDSASNVDPTLDFCFSPLKCNLLFRTPMNNCLHFEQNHNLLSKVNWITKL